MKNPETQQQTAAEQCIALRKQLEAVRAERDRNLNVTRQGADSAGSLDSSVRRNTALIKKLRGLSEETHASILDDIARMDQSKYVSEAVAAIAEASLRPSDIPAAVKVCSALHRRYPDFSSQIAAALAKAFQAAGSSSGSGESASRRRRALLRLLVELLSVGVYSGAGVLLTLVKELANQDFKKERDSAHTALSLLASFAKTSADLLAESPPSTMGPATDSAEQEEAGNAAAAEALQTEQAALQEEISLRFALSEPERHSFTKVFERCYDGGATALQEEHTAMIAQERENALTLNTRGELSAEVAAEYERRRKAYESLHRGVVSLAEVLGRPAPTLHEDAFTRTTTSVGGTASADADSGPVPAFEDLETRSFYESLPDLRALVPAILLVDRKEVCEPHAPYVPRAVSAPGDLCALGQSTGVVNSSQPCGRQDSQAADADEPSDPGQDDDDPIALSPDAAASAALSTDMAHLSLNPNTTHPTTQEPAALPSAATASTPQNPPLHDSSTTSSTASAASAATTTVSTPAPGKATHAPGAASTDLCDEVAVNFCFVSSKAARRRLVKALCSVPRASLQLLPYYARVVAVLGQLFPDVPQAVIAFLDAEFNTLLVRKDMTAHTLEPRLRNARYLAELAKFKLLPPGPFFSHLRQLLDDFQGHNIDAAVAMVETAGLFMHRVPETHDRMEHALQTMMRKRTVQNLGPRLSADVDSAFYQVKRPDKASLHRKKRPPMQEYIRHLLFEVLNNAKATSYVARQLLKLPWKEHEAYVLKCMMKVVRGRFTNIPVITCLAGGLAHCHESLGIAFVDAVLEDIRWGLEHPVAGMYQKRTADIRLLGEQYNYMLCHSLPIFDTLYLLTSFGHETPERLAALDPPDDFFRIRLVCALLETCGCYFNEGAARKHLDRFLTFLQAYLLSKPTLPLDVDFDLQDVFQKVRPKLHRFATHEEALAAVDEILTHEAEVGASLGTIGEGDGSESEEEEEGERRGGGGGGGGTDGDQSSSSSNVRGAVLARSLSDVSDRSDDGRGDKYEDEFELEFASLMTGNPSGAGGSSGSSPQVRQAGTLVVAWPQPGWAAAAAGSSRQDPDPDPGKAGWSGGAGGGLPSVTTAMVC
ncbi:MAG: hypothetical protein WDW38_006816 [Sanguina aurantia]